LLIHSGASTDEGQFLKLMFHNTSIEFMDEDGDITDGAYATTEGLASNYMDLFPTMKKFSLTQEFGTISNIRVLLALILENAAYNYGSYEERVRFSTMTRDAFRVPKLSWKQQIVNRGLVVFTQLYESEFWLS